MPLRWLAVDGKRTRCEIAAVGSKVDFVVRLGQQQDAAHGTVSRGVGRVRLPALRGQDAVQVVQDESLGELTEHALAKVILHARFLEFAAKERLLVSGARHALRLRHKRPGRRERDAMVRANGARCGR